MLPTWMIEKMASERREREAREEQQRARLWVELPVRDEPEPPAAPAGSTAVTIVWGEED